MLTFPYLSPNGRWSNRKGGSQLLFSLRIKALFTCSVISCVPASCVGNFALLPRDQGPPLTKSNGWMATPSSQRGAPQPILGTQVT